MGALGNAFRKLVGGGGAESSGGLVLAARHYARVNQTWRRAEALGTDTRSALAVAPVSSPASVRAAAAARPDLANWDLPPGLASVVHAERMSREPHSVAPPTDEPTRVIRRARDEESSAAGDGVGSASAKRPMGSREMESLLRRLAD